jgi:hypothetical protein
MKSPWVKWCVGIFLLFLWSLSSSCKATSSTKNNSTYYTYDSKYGGYPTGRIEKQGNTYYIYDSKYGRVIPPEGLRRRGIHTASIKANTGDIRWDGLRKSDVQEIMGGENSGDMRVSI